MPGHRPAARRPGAAAGRQSVLLEGWREQFGTRACLLGAHLRPLLISCTCMPLLPLHFRLVFFLILIACAPDRVGVNHADGARRRHAAAWHRPLCARLRVCEG